MFVGIGQDSHRFLVKKDEKKCMVGGLHFPDVPGLLADSDGDVILHAICNAITSITHVPILGEIAPKLCQKGFFDSSLYVKKALETLEGKTISHVAISIEGKRPRFQKKSAMIREKVAQLLQIHVAYVGITFTSGDELTSFGRGEGLQCFCTMTVIG